MNGLPKELIDSRAKGQPLKLNAEQLRALEEIGEKGLIPRPFTALCAGQSGERSQPHKMDQRTKSAWNLGTVCPAKGKGAGL